MIQHRFEYLAPRLIDEALQLLSNAGDECAVLGGGTWLIPNMTFAINQPRFVIDPRHLGFDAISELGDDIFLGARVTYTDALNSPVISAHLPLLAAMCAQITGGASIVGQGTIGGSACYANPSSDVPACLVALRARLRFQSVSGPREIEAADFFRGAFSTAIRPDEMLEGILLPKMRLAARWGYYKLKFSTGSWPIVTAAVNVEPGDEGDRYRVALGAATAVPVLSEAVLHVSPDADELDSFAKTCACVHPDAEWSDELAEAGYRRRVARSVVMRALGQSGASR